MSEDTEMAYAPNTNKFEVGKSYVVSPAYRGVNKKRLVAGESVVVVKIETLEEAGFQDDLDNLETFCTIVVKNSEGDRHYVNASDLIVEVAPPATEPDPAPAILDAVMTAAEAQIEFGLSASAVRKAIEASAVPARKSGGTWLILRTDAEARWGKRKPASFVINGLDPRGQGGIVTKWEIEVLAKAKNRKNAELASYPPALRKIIEAEALASEEAIRRSMSPENYAYYLSLLD